MQATPDSIPGQWTLWLRTKEHPQLATYEVAFDSSGGLKVTTSGGISYTGTWHAKEESEDENVTFHVEGLQGAGEKTGFKGYAVGLAMGGYITGFIAPIIRYGAWSAYKTSD